MGFSKQLYLANTTDCFSLLITDCCQCFYDSELPPSGGSMYNNIDFSHLLVQVIQQIIVWCPNKSWEWRCSRSIVCDSLRSYWLYVAARFLRPWDFSRQEYWSVLPFPSPGDLPHPGMELTPPALRAGSLRSVQFSSVHFSRSVVSDSLWPHELQHARPPCPSPTTGVHANSCPSSRWCHPTISSSVVPFSSWPQSLPASESFPMSQLFPWGGQSIGVSALPSVVPMNTQNWSRLWWTGWISLQSEECTRVYSNITVQNHQFFGA